MRLLIRREDKAPIEIIHDGKKSCYELLAEHGITLPASCGGTGRCGKCRILFCEGAPVPKAAEREALSQKEIEEGYRLACCCKLTEDAVVELQELECENMEILTVEDAPKPKKRGDIKAPAFAVDIGTTTIAVTLFDAEGGATIDSASAVNRGRIYGTDVLSRIAAANDGKKDALRDLLREDLLQLFHKLLHKNRLDFFAIEKIVISGNTTMQHLLLGYSCEKLGRYPFVPVELSPEEMPFARVFDTEESNATVCFAPGVSAFIGGDILLGVYESGMARKSETAILIDLGTNGEMVLGNSERLLAASVAAGPALEGGNIEKGVPGVSGAISHVQIAGKRVRYETIQNATPIGICGSGVLDTVAELWRTGAIDEFGTFTGKENKITIANGIIFSQNDVRQVQMAKAAIRAGIELLASDYGILPGEVEKIYLAGGFGYQLKEETAIALGLLPTEWRGRLIPLGNSSLKGAVRLGSTADGKSELEQIAAKIKEQNLAENPKFEETYLNFMNFS